VQYLAQQLYPQMQTALNFDATAGELDYRKLAEVTLI
jgi:hypothetical protein